MSRKLSCSSEHMLWAGADPAVTTRNSKGHLRRLNRQIWLGERGNRNISQSWLHFWTLERKYTFCMPIVTSHRSSQFCILIYRNGVLRNISPKRHLFWTPEEILHRHKGSLFSCAFLQRLPSLQWLLWQTERCMSDTPWPETASHPTFTSHSTGACWAMTSLSTLETIIVI